MSDQDLIELLDITAPDDVEIHIDRHGKTIWINVNGICRFRACRIGSLTVIDDREGTSNVQVNTPKK